MVRAKQGLLCLFECFALLLFFSLCHFVDLALKQVASLIDLCVFGLKGALLVSERFFNVFEPGHSFDSQVGRFL